MTEKLNEIIIVPCVNCTHYFDIGIEEPYCKFYDWPLTDFDSKGFLNHENKKDTLFQCGAYERRS